MALKAGILPHSSVPGAGRRGMALFISLVVVMILYVLVYQLWHSAALEIRIARNQGGYLKGSLALQSAVAYSIALIQEDLEKDVEDSQGSVGAGPGISQLSASRPGGDPSAVSSTKKGVEKVGQPSAAAKIGRRGLYDYINESIFQPRRQQVNDISVKIEIVDGESRINLNKLYGYVSLWQKEEPTLSELDAQRKGEKKKGSSGSKGKETGSKKDSSAEDELASILGRGMTAGLPEAQEEEEWEEPDPEQREAARRLLADLIIHMVESNIENGFVYARQYDADLLGEQIEQYVFERKSGSAQNYIFSTSELLQIEGITPELYNGPLPPELIEQQEAPGPGQEGYRRDEFGDIVYDFGLGELPGLEELNLQADEESLDQLRDLGTQFGLGDLRELIARGTGSPYGWGRTGGYLPGMASLAEAPYPDNEEGTGIIRPPKPLGLKHLLCTFSNGKINLNTAPMEVIMALFQGGGNPAAWDNEAKLEVARAIVEYRDQYTEDYLKELEEQEQQGFLGDSGLEEQLPPEAMGLAGTGDLRTNYFTSLADLQKIGDGELLKTDKVDSGRGERSLGWLVRKDLGPVTVFNSEYFEVRIVAKQRSFRQEATFVVHRDTKKKIVSVVYFRERGE